MLIVKPVKPIDYATVLLALALVLALVLVLILVMTIHLV
jgi:hypothetical protein